jgi:glycosyltransferase involved in cell wall biosynthesis
MRLSTRHDDETLISVVMPVREYRSHTAAAVASILAQTHAAIELLIVGHDDVQLLLDRLPKDIRIRGLSRSAPGIVGALNSGLHAASGVYIARMDDDDISRPKRLAAQLNFMRSHPIIDLCGARVTFFSDDVAIGEGNRRYEHWLNQQTVPDAIHHQCFVECPLPHPTLFAHRDVWQALDGYRNNPWPEDYDLILRAWLLGMQMGKPDGILLDWREHAGRLTWHDPRYRREAFIQAKAWALAHSELLRDRGRAVWLCGTGRNARYWFDALTTLEVEVKGFVDLDRPASRQRKRHRPVITYASLWKVREDELVITAVTNLQAREQLTQWFAQQQWVSGRDYILGG